MSFKLVATKKVEKKKHYSHVTFSKEIPNSIDIQRQSFYSFLEKGFKIAFQETLSFSTISNDLEILFFPESIKYQKPDFTKNQAFTLGKTYGSGVFIPVGIYSKKSSLFRVEWLLIGLLPLMTKQGHFIVNGVSRVVLHQMIRNSGIYIIPCDAKTQKATVRIVPEKGGWINLTVDKKNRLWFSTRVLRRKVSLLIFLQALGISLTELFQRLEDPKILANSYVKELSSSYGETRHDKILKRAGLQEHPNTQEQAWRYLYAHFLEYSPYARALSRNHQTARDFFCNTLWNTNFMILGQIGRQQFREKLASPIPLDDHFLRAEDIELATQALLKLIYKKTLGDEIDSLAQKKIRGCNEFLLEQLLRGIKEFEVLFKRKILTVKESPVLNSLITETSFFTDHNTIDLMWRQNKNIFSKVISKSWKTFFTGGTLAQFMDQTNPLAEVTQKRRLTVLGPGGVSSKQTTIKIRSIHPTYYGRLCPIETPEGKNAGLVNSFTVVATLSTDFSSTINTPFYQVYKGQVQKNLPPLLISPHQEFSLISAPADIQVSRWNLLPKTPLPVRKEYNFEYNLSCNLGAQSIGSFQNISVATSLIPFLEHDDANRALMGSNMQRQAVPLIAPQVPFVGTGLETRVVCDVNHIVQAKKSGYINQITEAGINIITPKMRGTANSRVSNFFKPVVSIKHDDKFLFLTKKLYHPIIFFGVKLEQQKNIIFRTKDIFSKNDITIKQNNFLNNYKKNEPLNKSYFFFPKSTNNRNFKNPVLSSCKFFSSKNFFYKEKSLVDVYFENRKLKFSSQQTRFQKKEIFEYLVSQNFCIQKIYNLEKNQISQNTRFHVLKSYKKHSKSITTIKNKNIINTNTIKTFFLGFKEKTILLNKKPGIFFDSCINHRYLLFQEFQRKEDLYPKKKTRVLSICLDEKNIFFLLDFFSLNNRKKLFTKKIKSQLLNQKKSLIGSSKKAEYNESKMYKCIKHQRTNQSTLVLEKPVLSETMWVEKGDILADGAASSHGKLSIGQNVLIAYLPWEGYNFEDAILISQRLVDQDNFTSLHIDHYDIEVKNTQHGLERITNKIPLKINESTNYILKNEQLNFQGLVEIGCWVKEGDYLVGKISPLNPKGPSIEHQYEKLYNVIMQREKTNFRNTSLRVPKGVEGFVLDVQILPSQQPDVSALAETNDILRVRVVLLQRRKIQVGDKMAGRHGNKGIVSKIIPRHDMPYLPDGTPVDIVLNPLGVPSRMNVGQIFECLLGLAGSYLNESYTLNLFDEQFGVEASRSLVYSKLYQASVKSSNSWLFEPHHPGKIKIFDGRTGIPFDQPVTVGCAYILKLVHLVDDKIHARATGPYSAVTQQPVKGRSRNGGQRLGEMEVWALQAYGAAYTLHELLTVKSDDIEGRKQAVVRIYANKKMNRGHPESFKIILRELQALCFDLKLYGSQEPTIYGPMVYTQLEQIN